MKDSTTFRGPIFGLFLAITALFGCEGQKENKPIFGADDLMKSHRKLEEAIINDFFSPPVAVRIYTYSHVAAFEVLAKMDSSLQPLAGQLRDLNPIPEPEKGKKIDLSYAALVALSKTGRKLVYTEYFLDSLDNQLLSKAKSLGMAEPEIQQSIAYGEAVSKHILDWASKDNYKQMRSWDFYTPIKEEGKWIPTPPDYFDALEPHWPKLRCMVLDSAAQFRPAPPTPYSKEKNSAFYKEAMEVYDSVKNKNDSTVAIAKFWDDAPFQPTVKGHMMSGQKKLTPPGHWLCIGQNIAHEKDFDLSKLSEMYTLSSIAMLDATISCWDAKYYYNYIRPVTVLQSFKEDSWMPILYTPNFPEYTSGHSVFSGAASEVMTLTFGDNYAFTDSSEQRFGLENRKFTSFSHAADEAAISRMYGGIHFMPAIVNGVQQGREVGKFTIQKIKTRK